jgi:8-oxo-dGTP diphosphatase
MSAPPAIPYKIAVLAYIFNSRGQLLLLHRKKPPNQDLFSPVGGKLEQAMGESPYACALREIHEEVGIQLSVADIRLLGIVSERAFTGAAAKTATPPVVSITSRAPAPSPAAHWLMFCFEVTRPQDFPPRQIDEGRLEWFDLGQVAELNIPKTDREVIWPLVREHCKSLNGPRANDFFSVHIDCRDADNFTVTHEHPIS